MTRSIICMLLFATLYVRAGEDLGLAAAYCEKALERFIAGKSPEGEIQGYLNDNCSDIEYPKYLEHLEKVVIRDGLNQESAALFTERVRKLAIKNRIFMLALLHARAEYMLVYTTQASDEYAKRLPEAQVRNALLLQQERRERILAGVEEEANPQVPAHSTEAGASASTSSWRIVRLVQWLLGDKSTYRVGTVISIPHSGNQ